MTKKTNDKYLKNKTVKEKVINFIKPFLITLVAFFSWWGLTLASIILLNWLNTEHYNYGDVPNEKFSVQIIDEKGIQQAKSWEEVQNHPNLWVTEAMQLPHNSEDFLVKKEDGSLMYYNEGAMWNSQSHYRIDGNKLIPISFLFFSIGTVLFAMLMASVTYAIFKYIIKRWLYRHSREKTDLYNQEVCTYLQKVLIWFGLFIGCYGVMSLLNK